MTKKYQIYRCNVCGNIVKVLHEGAGTLVCCGQDMELLVEQMADEGMEKHVPVVKVEGNKVIVDVGSVAHPMEEAHFMLDSITRLYTKGSKEPQEVYVRTNNGNDSIKTLFSLLILLILL